MRFAMLIACATGGLSTDHRRQHPHRCTCPIVFQEPASPTPATPFLANVIVEAWVRRSAPSPPWWRSIARPQAAAPDRHRGNGCREWPFGRIVSLADDRHLVVVTMFLVMGAYLVSLAPLAWLIMLEIFPNRLRGKAMAVASVCVWSAAS